ncbi:hypothetical protein [Ancylobacter sp. SL191]|uniref:hypothetical protein n=1 Tax=Ancylobacter sp. SL191 TaxID=2995166 RepID=UPI002270A1F0|nr:hypothetical protein [Ancylobacter sp. SL191]WAC28336.1 hypothetical protein OU996_04550 [Ancylobacter sp. SL191]
MHKTEETARAICALDLRARGVSDAEVPALVDRFWPVLANEIRQGIVEGSWPFSAQDIEALTQDYRRLLKARR